MNIFDLIEKLQKTTKKTEKERLLESVKRDDIIKTFLRYTYDPNILSNMKKIEVKQVGDKDFYEMFTGFIKLYDSLSKREITGNAARDAVRFFLEKCNEQTQKLFINSLKKDLKCGISVKTLNNVFGSKFIEYFEVQLANKYKPEKHNIKDYFISPKMDGCLHYNTLIETDKGKLKIGEIVENKINCSVKSFNIFENKIEFKPIKNFMKNGNDVNEIKYEWFEIEDNKGNKIIITGNHLVYLPLLGVYRRVDELKENDIILVIN